MTRTRNRRQIGPGVVLATIVISLLAVIPVGSALWSKVLGVSGEIGTGGQAPIPATLRFISVDIRCDPGPGLEVEIANVGDRRMDWTTELELWFSESGDPERGRMIEAVPIEQVPVGGSVTKQFGAVAGMGRYALLVRQMPGGSTGQPTWSASIDIDASLCDKEGEGSPADAVVDGTTTTTSTATSTTGSTSTTTTTVVPTTTTTTVPTTTTTTGSTSTTTSTSVPTTTTTSTTAP